MTTGSENWGLQWQAVGLSVLLAVAGGNGGCRCQYDGWAHRLTTVKPKVAEVAGVYVFDYQTVIQGQSELPEWKGRTNWVPELNLKLDGTYEMKDFPAWNSDSVFQGYVQQSGKWDIHVAGMVNDRDDFYGVRFDGESFWKSMGKQ